MVSEKIETAVQQLGKELTAGQYLPCGQGAKDFMNRLRLKIMQVVAERRFSYQFFGMDHHCQTSGNQVLQYRAVILIDHATEQLSLQCIIGQLGNDHHFKAKTNSDGSIKPLSSIIKKPVSFTPARSFRFPRLVNRRRLWR